MNILVALIALSFLIIIHELGHFTVAKLSGIKVLEFSLFMGPKLFSIQKGETQYSLRAIPLGGYVKMEGEEEASQDDRAFNKKPKLVRIAVLAAGSLANLFIALVIYTIILSSGGFVTTVVDEVTAELQQKGVMLQAGDRIIRYDGKAVDHPMDIALFMFGTKGKSVEMEIERDGVRMPIAFEPIKIEKGTQYRLGVVMKSVGELGTNEIESVTSGSVAQKAGMQAGDRIISLNADPIHNRGELGVWMQSNKDHPMDIGIERKDGSKVMLQGVVAKAVEQKEQYFMGLQFAGKKGNFFETVQNAAILGVSTVKNVFYSLVWLVTGVVSLNEMMGPVGIVSTIGEVVQQGVSFKEKILDLLSLVGLISINLGVFNLIPFPALDGSKILLIGVEAIRRKPLPPEREAMISFFGFILLLMLMAFTMINDISRLLG